MNDDREGHCAACGAPLADDQRWCLECGARRAGLAVPVSLSVGGPPAPGGSAPPSRDRASLTFVAVVACLLVALALGVLIGRSRGTPAVAGQPAPREVITVSVPAASGPAAATTPAPVATATTTTPEPAATGTTTTPPARTGTTTTPSAPQDTGDVPQGDADTPVGDGTEATEIG